MIEAISLIANILTILCCIIELYNKVRQQTKD